MPLDPAPRLIRTEEPEKHPPAPTVSPTETLRTWLLADPKRLDLSAKEILQYLPDLQVSVTYINKIKRVLKEGE